MSEQHSGMTTKTLSEGDDGKPFNGSSIGELLQSTARNQPDNGFHYLNEGKEIQKQSYSRLQLESTKALTALNSSDITGTDIIISFVGNPYKFVTLLYACFQGGIPILPIAPREEPGFNNASFVKLESACSIIRNPVIVTDQPPSTLNDWTQEKGITEVKILNYECLSQDSDLETFEVPAVDPDSDALLLMTSGSTGVPKIVRQSHRNLTRWARSCSTRYAMRASDKSLNWMPLDHVGGIVMFSMKELFAGCNQLHAPSDLVLKDPLLWLKWIDREKVTLSWAPNFAYGLINALEAEISELSPDLSSIRYLLNGGEAVVPSTARKFLKILEPYGLKNTCMSPAWGMSETCSAASISINFSLEDTSDSDTFTRLGKPIDGVEMRVVSPSGDIVVDGTIGSLQIRGISITPGYLYNNTANEQSFTDDGWFITGDLAKFDLGELCITGREKDVIVSNGLNVYIHEIESVIESIDGVLPSFATAIPARRELSDSDEVAVFFATDSEDPLKHEEIKQGIRSGLISTLGVNANYIIVLDESNFPKTSIGKIQRAKLKQKFEAGEFDQFLFIEPSSSPLLARKWLPQSQYPASSIIDASEAYIILENSSALCDSLFSQITECGASIFRVYLSDCYKTRTQNEFEVSGSMGDFDQLFREIPLPSFGKIHIFNFWTLDSTHSEVLPKSVGSLLERTTFLNCFNLLKSLSNFQSDSLEFKIISLTKHSVLVNESDSINPTSGMTLGLLRAANRDFENLESKCIDLEDPDGDTAPTLNAILTGADHPTFKEIALRDGKHYFPMLRPAVPQKSDTGPETISKNGIILIIGATGGIGQSLVQHILNTSQNHILMLGRGALDINHPLNTCLSQSKAETEKIRYSWGNLQDAQFIRNTVDEFSKDTAQPLIQAFVLTGIFHEKLISEESNDSIKLVLESKVGVALSTHLALANRPDCQRIYFSSVLSILPSAGSSMYAASNAALESLAQYERQNGINSQALQWSVWIDRGMASDADLELIRQKGLHAYTSTQAIELMESATECAEPVICLAVNANHRANAQYFNFPDTNLKSEHTFETPRNEYESAVLKIWQDVLKKESISIHDSFLDIGGKSLNAAKMFARIKSELGFDLPLATLYEAPSIAQLCERFQPSAPSEIRMLKIRHKGDRAPLFMIPGGGSDVIVFQDISDALGDDFPVYGLQAPGLDATEIEEPFPSVEEVSSRFIEEIQKIQKQGPYHIFGHCFGCLLAWELSRQLEESGQEVKMLGMLDPIVSNVFSGEILGRDRIRYHFSKFLNMSIKDKLNYFVEKVRNFSRTLVVRNRISQAYEMSNAMHAKYTLTSSPLNITVFLAEDSFFKITPERDPRRYYEKIANSTQYVNIQGDHHSILHGAGAGMIADAIKERVLVKNSTNEGTKQGS